MAFFAHLGGTPKLAKFFRASVLFLLAVVPDVPGAVVTFTGGVIYRNGGTTVVTGGNSSYDNVDYYVESGFVLDYVYKTQNSFGGHIGTYYGGTNDVIHGHWTYLSAIEIHKVTGGTFDFNYFVLTSNTRNGGTSAAGNEVAYVQGYLNGVATGSPVLLPPENWGFPSQQVYFGSDFNVVDRVVIYNADSYCFGMDEFYFDEAAPPVVVGSQYITFPEISTKRYGDPNFSLGAYASSGLPVTYTCSNPSVATVSSNGVVTILEVGSATIYANQAGNAQWNPATQVFRTLTVEKGLQTISFGSLVDKTTTDAPFSLVASVNSGLPISFSSSATSVATVSGSTVTLRGAGTTTITASQAGDSHWNAATSVGRTLTVTAVDNRPVITSTNTFYGTVGTLGSNTLTASGATPMVFSASNLPAGLSIETNSGVISGTPTTAGTNPVVLGAVNSFGSTTRTNSFVIFKGTPLITSNPSASPIRYGQALSSSSLSGGAANVPGSFAFQSPAKVPALAGTGLETVIFTPSDTANYATAAAAIPVTVQQLVPQLTWAPLDPVPYGTALSGVHLNAASSMAGTFGYAPGFGTVLDAGQHTLVATFTPTDTTNTVSGLTITNTLLVNPGTHFILFPDPGTVTYGDAPFQLRATASSGLPVRYTSSNPALAEVSSSGWVQIRGAGTVTLTAYQDGNSNYPSASPVQFSLVIQPKTLTVSSGLTPVSRNYNGTLNVEITVGTPVLQGVVPGDVVALVTTGVAGRLANPLAGNGKAVTVTGLSLSGNDRQKYVLGSLVLSVDIAKLPVEFLADNKERRYPNANPSLTWRLGQGGVAEGDSVSVSLTCPATQQSLPGTYPIQFASLSIRNSKNEDVTASYQLTTTPGVLTVLKGLQTLTFAVIPAKTYGDGYFELAASSDRGLSVQYSSDTPSVVSISGTLAMIRAAGSATITASQAGTDLWEAAIPVSRQVTVHPKSLSVWIKNSPVEIFVGSTPVIDFDVDGLVAPDTKDSVFTADFRAGWLTTKPVWNGTLTGYFAILRGHSLSPPNYFIQSFQEGVLVVLPGPGVADGSVSPLAGGYDHSVLLRKDGGVSVWGSTTNGQANVPVGLANVAGVAAGLSANFTLAWKKDGTVVGWGNNSTVINTNVLNSLSNVLGVAAGTNHGLALIRGGTVRAWGNNSSFQTNVPTNLVTTNGTNFVKAVAVAAAESFSLALLADGRIQFWGQNSYLNGSLTNTAGGSYLAGVTNAVGMAAGVNFVLSLRSDGRVQYAGSSGNATASLPADLTNATVTATNPAVAVAAGANHGLAWRRNGTVLVWGLNNQGQTNLPTNLVAVAASAGGYQHSLFLRRDGSVAVGANSGNTNQITLPSGIVGAVPRGGPDSDGDGWSNEAELRAGTSPLNVSHRPSKVTFANGSLTNSFTEGPAGTSAGTLRILDTMGWPDATLASGLSLWGQDADLFQVVGGELVTKVPLDYDSPSSPRKFTVVLEVEGLAEILTLNLNNNTVDDDLDGDGLTNAQEVALGTNPNKPDTDGDGLSDGVETNTGVFVSAGNTGTNPLRSDTDGDGLSDGVETNTGVYSSAFHTGTHPLVADTDGDGRSDGAEVASGISPLDNLSYPGAPSAAPVVVQEGWQNRLTFSRILPLGATYQLQVSDNMVNWENLGDPVVGMGSKVEFSALSSDFKKFYRIIALP